MSYTSSKIEFPGLGIGEFTIDRVAFTVFGKSFLMFIPIFL